MKARGHTLGVVMVGATVAISLVGVFVTRLSIDLEARRAQADRTQALTLVRSACATSRTGVIDTPRGRAEVSRHGSEVTARLGAVEAVQDCGTGRVRVGPTIRNQ